MQTLVPGCGDVLRATVRLRRQLLPPAQRRPQPWPDFTRRLLAASGPGAITRHKYCALAIEEPLAAAVTMDTMDYDVHLFTDADTGEEAVVYRSAAAGTRLARQYRPHPAKAPNGAIPGPVTVLPAPAPLLDDPEAVGTLCARGLPFLFYTHMGTFRGHLLYRRYDANLTLVSPLPETPREPVPRTP
nr:sigma 54 modulation/S30EA ribosomal C-terminal domain-containing protein [Nocardia transvalensis]